MNWRLASRLSVITFAILVVVVVTVIQNNKGMFSGTTAAGSSGLQGSDLGSTTAPNFTLTDQNGKQVSLSQFKGRPVVLTFLYTHCPDQCPLTAERLHSSMISLGNDASKVGVIAVSTDPKGDTQQAAQKFTLQHNMQDYWHYLVGTQETLAPVWTAYNVYAQGQQQSVDHTLAIYIIDKQGRERTFFGGNNFNPEQVTNDLKILLKE
ncbi:MAG: hypothetical protein NVS4B12_19030 [Ktedonobacteraceae bacterium]